MAAHEATMQLWNVPYEDRFVSSRFGSTHLVVCGPKEAPPLVLLHCYFLTQASWAYNIVALSRNYRVYAVPIASGVHWSTLGRRSTDRETTAARSGYLTTRSFFSTRRELAALGVAICGGFTSRMSWATGQPPRLLTLSCRRQVGNLPQ